MNLPEIRIQFDKADKTFLAGDLVSGLVTIVVRTRPLFAKSIEIQQVGKAKVEWKERIRRKGEVEIKRFHNSQYLFKNKVSVFCAELGNSEQLNEGLHECPFAFQLPDELPSSMEAKHGWIKYYVKIKLGHTWLPSSRIMAEFVVQTKLDLNSLSNVARPAEVAASKSLCCLWCKQGPVSAKVAIPQLGYVPGQRIRVNCEVDNKSKNLQVRPYLKMRLETKFQATTGKTKTCIDHFDLVHLSTVGPADSITQVDVPYPIPSKITPELVGCNIMTLKYFFALVVDMGGINGLILDIPITIGTAPLLQSESSLAPSAPPLWHLAKSNETT